MLKIISIILVFFISIANVMANGPDRLYRGDRRTPYEIIKAGGFLPAGDESPGELHDASILNHAVGEDIEHTVYVSTSINRLSATSFGHAWGHLYTIHPAQNLYSTNDILGRFSPVPSDQEYVALGGIPLQQIMGWRQIRSFDPDDPSSTEYGAYVENPHYRPDIYEGMAVTPTEGSAYSLAGFPRGHEAWREEPWRDFALGGCNGPNNRANIIDACEAFVDEVGSARRAAFNRLINKYNKVINAPLKVLVAGGTEECISLFDNNRAAGATPNCNSAPNVRFTRYGQFQFPGVANPKLPLCLSVSYAVTAHNS